MSSRSDSEGEIHEVEVVDKATLAQPSSKIITVDRLSRPRTSASTSPGDAYEDLPRRRCRSPRGEKRRRDDDFYSDRDRRDPRSFKVRYEERRPYDHDYRPRVSYADIDRSDSCHLQLMYDDSRGRNGDSSRHSQHPTRSRSPLPRRNGPDRAYERHNARHESARVDRSQRGRENGVHERSRERQDSRKGARSDAQQDPGMSCVPNGLSKAPDEVDAHMEDLPEHPVDYATETELRRKKREAIKAKYMQQCTSSLRLQVLQPLLESESPCPQNENSSGCVEGSLSPMTSSQTAPQGISTPVSPPAVAVDNDEELANRTRVDMDNAEGPSAADYDPTMDMQEDRSRIDQAHCHDLSAIAHQHARAPPTPPEHATATANAEGLPEKVKSKDEFDMFAEDEDDDMFAEAPPPAVTTAKNAKAPHVMKLDSNMLDVWDDHQGYYKVILNELLDDRYEVQARLGKGVFSEVVRAKDIKTGHLVAIKIIRNDEVLRKSGVKEIEMLEKLINGDPDDRRHCIRLERWFDHKHHLCMVFEHLSINLREVLKKFGRDVGLHLKAVRSYAQQMFIALSLIHKCNIVHADIKPDNMLVDENRTVLKICDLGSAADISECEVPAGLLVSRFYRAPEIMLGIPHDFGIDMWAIGCTLFELYTGKILFTGRDNNQMLRSIQECRGKISPKLLKKGWVDYVIEHFDANLQTFRSVETDKITGKDVTRMLNLVRPTRDLKSRLISSTKGLSEVEVKEILLFHDLLDKCLAVNPEKRITPVQALKHPFIHRTKS